MASSGGNFRELARRRLVQRAADPLPPEEQEARRRRGYRVVRLPGLDVLIRDYSLPVEGEDG